MPFPNGVSHVARLLEVVGHQGHVDGDARWHEGLDVHVLPSHPVRVLAGHHGDPAGGAGGLHVVLVQQDPGGGQLLENWTVDVRIVPGYIVPSCRE